jgi:hypothetical protein
MRYFTWPLSTCLASIYHYCPAAENGRNSEVYASHCCRAACKGYNTMTNYGMGLGCGRVQYSVLWFIIKEGHREKNNPPNLLNLEGEGMSRGERERERERGERVERGERGERGERDKTENKINRFYWAAILQQGDWLAAVLAGWYHRQFC